MVPLDHRDLALQSLDDYGSQLESRLRGLELEESRWMPTPEPHLVNPVAHGSDGRHVGLLSERGRRQRVD